MTTSIPWTLGSSLETKLFSNGIESYAESMEEVADRTSSIKLIVRVPVSRTNCQRKEVWLKD